MSFNKPSFTSKALALSLAGAFCLAALPLAAQTNAQTDIQGQAIPTAEELWAIIQHQQKEIDALKGGSAQPKSGKAPSGEVETLKKQVKVLEKRADRAEKNLEAASDLIEESTQELEHGSAWDRTSIGGYGELHYNGGDSPNVDLHRFVLFFGHRFNDWISVQSELEVEHALVAGDGSSSGEVELEQAFIDFKLSEEMNAQTGVILVPVGILNETHEPNTFYGTERNNVEKNIIPTTWWEAGVNLKNVWGDSGFSSDLFFSSGLSSPTSGSNAYKPRNGRGKVSKQIAEDGAVTGRVRWTGIPGVNLSAVVQYQANMTQNQTSQDLDAHGWLSNANLEIQRGPWGFRGLFARWDVSGSTAKSLGRDIQQGWYLEPSYRHEISEKWGVVGTFFRYNYYDNNAGNSNKTGITEYQMGFNYWPHPDVVMKADYDIIDRDDGGDGDDRINLGLGWQF